MATPSYILINDALARHQKASIELIYNITGAKTGKFAPLAPQALVAYDTAVITQAALMHCLVRQTKSLQACLPQQRWAQMHLESFLIATAKSLLFIALKSSHSLTRHKHHSLVLLLRLQTLLWQQLHVSRNQHSATLASSWLLLVWTLLLQANW